MAATDEIRAIGALPRTLFGIIEIKLQLAGPLEMKRSA